MAMIIESSAAGIGIVLVSVNGWLVNNWVHNHYVLAFVAAGGIPFLLTIPESYRWHFGRG